MKDAILFISIGFNIVIIVFFIIGAIQETREYNRKKKRELHDALDKTAYEIRKYYDDLHKRVDIHDLEISELSKTIDDLKANKSKISHY